MRNRFGRLRGGSSVLSPENFVIPWGPGCGRSLGEVAGDERLLRMLLGQQWDEGNWTFGTLFLEAVINVYHSRPRLRRKTPNRAPRPAEVPS